MFTWTIPKISYVDKFKINKGEVKPIKKEK